jgi:hypothetical protein
MMVSRSLSSSYPCGAASPAPRGPSGRPGAVGTGLWGSITRCAYTAWEYSLISPARTWRRRTGGVASADRWTKPIARWIRRLIRSRVAEFVEDGGEAEVVGTPVVRR